MRLAIQTQGSFERFIAAPGFSYLSSLRKVVDWKCIKSHSKYYSYYHCFDGCTCRFRADHVNNLFGYELKKYMPRPEMVDVYKMILSEAWHDQTGHIQDDQKKLLIQIKGLEEKLSYIRDLLSSKQIDPADFREMKVEYSNKLERLEARLSAYTHEHVNIDDLLDKSMSNLLKLDCLYETGEVEKKRECD